VIIRGNALALPLANDSVDLICTSPPYFGLRSYSDNGVHYSGQLGSEPTPAEFVDALIAATREMVRVLKPSGSIWVNLGDKYAGSQPGSYRRDTQPFDHQLGDRSHRLTAEGQRDVADVDWGSVRAKSLIGIPWRYALRCIDELGLILRAEIIWSKPNGLPESVTDRVRRSHEQWFSFQTSGGVEAEAQGFPFCPQCGRPVSARSTLVARLQELDRSVESGHLPNHVRPDEFVQSQGASHTDEQIAAVPRRSGVPLLVDGHVTSGQDAADLLKDSVVAVVDHDAQMGVPSGGVAQTDRSLTVDDASEPSEFCTCVGHPLIINDEPWIPQSLAAEVMQMVANGEVDAQHAADFLSGDYARNHSVWFHFVTQPRYFSAVDEIREPQQSLGKGRPWSTEIDSRWSVSRIGEENGSQGLRGGGRTTDQMNALNPLGKLPGSVWSIPTQPLRIPPHLGVDHFAAFPMAWPRRIIQGWSPAGVCTGCGEGRRPVADRKPMLWRPGPNAEHYAHNTNRKAASGTMLAAAETTITGYACACPEPTAPTRPGVILDPFGGTGTTALVAKALGRHGISVDLSQDYCRLAEWRTNDPGQIADALQIEKPETIPDDQLSLFDYAAGVA
jgi:DNA modification methylase